MRTFARQLQQQVPVLRALGKVAAETARQRLPARVRGGKRGALQIPGPLYREMVPARPRWLIDDFLHHIGASPADFRGVVPPALFPQWAFPLQLRALMEPMRARGLNIARALNGGVTIDFNAPLPDDEPLEVTAQLVGLDEKDTRTVLTVDIITQCINAPNALQVRSSIVLPKGRRGGGASDEHRVPEGAEAIAHWNLTPNMGLQFALITGDFNPIHWVPPAAKVAGFGNVIMHGFSTMARAMAVLQRERTGRAGFARFQCRFTRALVLPARVGLFVRGEELWVGDQPGTRAYLTGSFTAKETP